MTLYVKKQVYHNGKMLRKGVEVSKALTTQEKKDLDKFLTDKKPEKKELAPLNKTVKK